MDRLARSGYRVHALDFPGFGKSEDPPWEITLQRLSQHLVAWISCIGLERFHLIGQSVGCEISVLVAASHPDQVASLTLAGPAGLPRLESLRHQIGLAALDTLHEPLQLYGAVLPDYFRCGPARLLRVLRAQKECPAECLLPEIRCPVLVLAGKHDRTVSNSRLASIQRAIPHSQTIRVEGAHGGHYTHPDAFSESVSRLLNEASAGGHPSPQLKIA